MVISTMEIAQLKRELADKFSAEFPRQLRRAVLFAG